MNIRRTFLAALLAVCCCFVLIGCAGGGSHKNATADYQYSGFLKDYSLLQPDEDGSGALRYRNSNVDIKKYKKVLFERVQIGIKGDAEYKNIDPTELKALTDYFQEAVKRELGTAYPIVDEPGPDVLRVRSAITELVPTKAGYSVVALVIPYATIADLAAGKASKGGAGSSPYLGEAAIEAEGLDGITGDVVFAYVERRIGKKYDVDMSKGAGQAVVHGYGEYFKSFTTWGYAKGAMDYWAKKFRARLDEIHGVSAGDKQKSAAPKAK